MKNKKKSLLFFVFILLLLSLVFNAVFLYKQSKKQSSRIKADALDIIDQKLNTTYSEVNNFPSGAADNLLFLSKLYDFKKENFTSTDLNNIDKYFLEFLTQSDAYYQISYIKNDGEILSMAQFDGEKRELIKDAKNTDFDKNYYLDLLKNLKNGEVYIFPLSLENKTPILKYATPIFIEETNTLEGIIVVKVYADYFLDNIRRSQRDSEKTYLINSDGFYLANSDKSKEFGYLNDKEENNFFVDYPNISKDFIDKCDERHMETDDKILTYRCINPTISSFEIYEGSKIINKNNENEYQWILITVTNKNEVLKDSTQQIYNYLWPVLIQAMIQGLIFVLLFVEKDFLKNE